MLSSEDKYPMMVYKYPVEGGVGSTIYVDFDNYSTQEVSDDAKLQKLLDAGWCATFVDAKAQAQTQKADVLTETKTVKVNK